VYMCTCVHQIGTSSPQVEILFQGAVNKNNEINGVQFGAANFLIF
jgi:hypothetical protein